MTKINDGGPAFPTEPNTQPGFYAHHGMKLRDWFAGQALAILRPSPEALERMRDAGIGPDEVDAVLAASAYHLADAMLAERERQP